SSRYFEMRAGVFDAALDVTSGTLAWRLGDDRKELAIPEWARTAVQFMTKASGAWSLAVAHDLVKDEDVPFLNVLVARLEAAGFIDDASRTAGGVRVTRRPHSRI